MPPLALLALGFLARDRLNADLNPSECQLAGLFFWTANFPVGLSWRVLPPPTRLHMNRDSASIDAQLTSWLLRRTAMTGVRRVASLNAAIATDVGSVRKENQDRLAVARGTDAHGQAYMVMALADGMGGMRGGAECAAIALGSFFASIHQTASNGSNSAGWLSAAALCGNASVYDKYRG